MEKLKAVVKWILANKRSISGTCASAAGSAIGIAAAWSIESLPKILLGNFNIAPILYTVFCLLFFVLNELGICGRGFESVVTFMAQNQLAEDKKTKTEAAKTAEKEIEEAKKAQLAAEAEAKKQVEEEAFRALVEAKKAELLNK